MKKFHNLNKTDYKLLLQLKKSEDTRHFKVILPFKNVKKLHVCQPF